MPQPLPTATVDLVQTLLFEMGLSPRRAASEAARQGVRVSRTTIRRILDDEYRGAATGDAKLDQPERCAGCGGRILVKPCRRCRVEQARIVLDRFRAIQARVRDAPAGMARRVRSALPSPESDQD